MTTIADDNKDNQYAFWCNICKVACASAVNLQTHFLGSKHKKVENALKAHGIVKSVAPENTQPGKVPDFVVTEAASQQGQTLEEQLDACRSSEPAIGLEYLYEYRTHDNYLYYECTLCNCETGLTNMFMHVVGAKHRLAYLTKHHPDLADVPGRGSELHKKLKQLAAEVEAKHGREKIQVVTDSQQLKRKYEGDFTGPNKSQRIDFTSDECYIESAPASTASGQGPSLSFQELKKAHAESMKQKIGGQDKSVDGFGTKKELLDYLKQFQILCEDDASFVLKVTQSFTRSLVQYRLKSKGGQEVAVAPQDSYPTEQTNTAPSVGQNIYTEYPPKNPPVQQPPVPTNSTYQVDANRSVTSAKPVSDAPISSYNSAPASFPAGPSPKEVVPAPTGAQGVQSLPTGSLGPLQETNKATIEFFTSIKNMDAEEVSATLNKIAASNPAFRGIDIPNVIKILSESGSLKPSIKSNKPY